MAREQKADSTRPLDKRDTWYSRRMFKTMTRHIGLCRVTALAEFPFKSRGDALLLELVSLPDTLDRDGLVRK